MKEKLDKLRIFARIKNDKWGFFDFILRNVGEILETLKEARKEGNIPESQYKRQLKSFKKLVEGDKKLSDKWFLGIRKEKPIMISHHKCSCGDLTHTAYDWDTGEEWIVKGEDIICPKCKKSGCVDCQ